MDKFSFSVLKGIGKRPAVTIKELAAIYNRSVDYMEDPVLYLRRCGYLDIERNYAALHDLTENSLIGRDTPLTISYGGRIAIECERKERRQSSFNEFRAWFTLAIAVAALIVLEVLASNANCSLRLFFICSRISCPVMKNTSYNIDYGERHGSQPCLLSSQS